MLSGRRPRPHATFGANAATVRVALATEDDQQDEPNATLTLALSDGADYDLGTTSEAEVTVEDNDDAPTVTLVLDPGLDRRERRQEHGDRDAGPSVEPGDDSDGDGGAGVAVRWQATTR